MSRSNRQTRMGLDGDFLNKHNVIFLVEMRRNETSVTYVCEIKSLKFSIVLHEFPAFNLFLNLIVCITSMSKNVFHVNKCRLNSWFC